jgi:hypothetical protein
VSNLNALQWGGRAGHYEVYYVTLTEPGTGVGMWIRYTLLAPASGDPTASLWFLAMDPRTRAVTGRKLTVGAAQLAATAEPFKLRIGDATLTDTGMTGAFEDVSWDLRWQPGRPYEHVHPLLRPVASTVLWLPHADVAVHGQVAFGDTRIELDGARGGQAHLFGSKHASRWAWIHCNDFDGAPDTFIDGVSVIVPRFGRQVGPSTPFVARIRGEDFASRSALRVLRNRSEFGLTGWRFTVGDKGRKLVGEVQAARDLLAGVTYHDPDGERAYCYNSEVASIELKVFERGRHVETLRAPGRAHYEYAARAPVAGIELLTT